MDFDGHFEATWGQFSNLTTPPYDADGDGTTFSDAELANIQAIWARVAEDFAPFNIDVTTELPTSFANGVAQRIAIGGSALDWYDPTGTDRVGGYAYIGAFTSGTANVAYVFPAQLGGGGATKNIADASSHEAGHSFWLRHQSLYATDGTKTAEYNPGSGGWAPLMGISYSAPLSTWHNGTSTSAATTQDDMAVISSPTNGFGYRPDDHGNTAAAATSLAEAGGGLSGSGVIEENDDVDAFSFATDAGDIVISLDVAPLGPNLDAVLELRNSANQVVVTADPTTSLGASINATVPAGTYTLLVHNNGLYGRVGQYTITGAVADTTMTALQPPRRVAPLGSAMLLSSDNIANLAGAADIDEFTFFAQAGQTIAAVGTATESSAAVTLELVAPDGSTAATVQGSPASLPPTPVSAGGAYRLRVFGDRATAVNVSVGFNLALETADTANNREMSIDRSHIALGDGRYAVVGIASPTGDASSTILDDGAAWRYLDDGSNQQTAWRTTAFNDASWASSASQFGYGDDDEQTLLEEFATDGSRIRTFYFRHHFTVSDPARFNALTLELLRDDGAAVYVNGTEVRRDNLVPNAGYNDFATATVNGGSETQFFPSAVDPAVLRTGDNVLAVEVHQRANNSTDVSFDLRLTGTTFASDVDEYTLDLTGKSGRRIDVALTGQGPDFASATLELLAPDGATVLATGTANPLGATATNFDRAVLDFAIPADGIYTIRVSSDVAGPYALLVTVGHALEHEPNDSPASPLVDLTERSGSAGFLAAGATDVVDRYQINLAAGESIALSTDTPMDHAAATPANTLNPRLRLLTSAEAVVAADNDSLDGRNARLETVVSEAGVYIIEVAAEAGTGEYILNVLHRLPPQITIRLSSSQWAPAFRQRLSSLGLGDGGIELSGNPAETTLLPWINVDTIHVAFSEPVELGRDDLRLTGVTTPDYMPNVVSFVYDPGTFTATWRLGTPFAADRVQLSLSGAIRDASGNPLANTSGKRFEVLSGDVTGDRVVRLDDFFASLGRQFSGLADDAYHIAADLDGSGAVNILDWQHVYIRRDTELPAPAAQPSPEWPENNGASPSTVIRAARRQLPGVRRNSRSVSLAD